MRLNNIPIPTHIHQTKIIGVTFNIHVILKSHHKHEQKKKTYTPRLNTLRALTGTDFGYYKETTSLKYKQYITSVIDYSSSSWASNQTNTHVNTLQTIQNKALRIIT